MNKYIHSIYHKYHSIYHKRAFQGFQENLFLYFSRFFKVFLESYLFSRFSRSLFGIQGFSRSLQVFQGSGHPGIVVLKDKFLSSFLLCFKCLPNLLYILKNRGKNLCLNLFCGLNVC